MTNTRKKKQCPSKLHHNSGSFGRHKGMALPLACSPASKPDTFGARTVRENCDTPSSETQPALLADGASRVLDRWRKL